MCFTIFSRKQPVKKVAKKDITVYKILTPELQSVFYPLRINGKVVRWVAGFEYRQTIPFKIKKARRNIWQVSGNAFHSYKSKPYFQYNKVIVKMIIPKGAKYLYSDNCYVSSKIVFPNES